MGQQYQEILEKHKTFIEAQKIFFVGTATEDSRVNISPKGMDSFRVLGSNRVIWLNVTGSGNETAAHVQRCPRMTVMFSAFEGKPVIMRLYGTAKVIHKNDSEWSELYSKFEPIAGARQIFDMQVEMLQTSCGMAVPYFEYVGERELLRDWAVKQGDEGLKKYWAKKNQATIDGLSTSIVELNT
ncbi:pyridoxamine 5'-phosphate oxidase family protein [Saccharophagus degradans]|uniref:pyridoxamine 5'-phosphate oxidase family protein n=1 Tax=Saccharophagus degradans TaxID=86304 RepID=UPI001C07F628|nr:pyridoxamine 5'-phosphate oxidase family protein [Saccharophagus degradans]MBU2986227.1 pyridoxamine 5'-phosphate oxidase family protein [Saccharophagus degradans]